MLERDGLNYKCCTQGGVALSVVSRRAAGATATTSADGALTSMSIPQRVLATTARSSELRTPSSLVPGDSSVPGQLRGDAEQAKRRPLD